MEKRFCSLFDKGVVIPERMTTLLSIREQKHFFRKADAFQYILDTTVSDAHLILNAKTERPVV